MKRSDLESIRNFKKKDDLLKWTHNNGATNLSSFIMYSIVDSIIKIFSLPLTPFDPKKCFKSCIILVQLRTLDGTYFIEKGFSLI